MKDDLESRLGAQPLAGPGPHLDDRIETLLLEAEGRWRMRRRRWVPVSLAAAAAVFLLSGALLLRNRGLEGVQPPEVREIVYIVHGPEDGYGNAFDIPAHNRARPELGDWPRAYVVQVETAEPDRT